MELYGEYCWGVWTSYFEDTQFAMGKDKELVDPRSAYLQKPFRQKIFQAEELISPDIKFWRVWSEYVKMKFLKNSWKS